MEPNSIDAGYVLRRGLVVMLIVAAVCGVLALVLGSGSDKEYTSKAAVSVSAKRPPAASRSPAPAGPVDVTPNDSDGDDVTFGPRARDARPETRQQQGASARSPNAGRAAPAPEPAPKVARAQLETLAANLSAPGVKADVTGSRTIEVEATSPSESSAEGAANAAAEALVQRASRLKAGKPPADVSARITDNVSVATSTEDSDAVGDLGIGLLIGLPVGIAVAALLHLISLMEARRAREKAAPGATGQL